MSLEKSYVYWRSRAYTAEHEGKRLRDVLQRIVDAPCHCGCMGAAADALAQPPLKPKESPRAEGH